MNQILCITSRVFKNLGIKKKANLDKIELYDNDFQDLTRKEAVELLKSMMPTLKGLDKQLTYYKEENTLIKRQLSNVSIDLKRATKKLSK